MSSVSNLSSVLEEFCLMNPDDRYCESFRYETTITVDDVNFLYLNISENPETRKIYGGYLLGAIALLGIIGNIIALLSCFMVRRWSMYHTYSSFIVISNIAYLSVSSGTESLQFSGVIQPLVLKHPLLCMMWPPLIDMLEHSIFWLVACLAIELTNYTKEHTSNRTTINSQQIKTFQAKLKCLAVLVVMVFLNYHSTLIRDLLNSNQMCKISSKAGRFYRNYWPWIKATCGVYVPLLVGVACSCLMVKRVIQRRHLHIQTNPALRINLFVICWYTLLSLTARIILHSIHYHMSLAAEENSNTTKTNQSAINIWLSGEIITAVKHSFVSVAVILISIRDINDPDRNKAIQGEGDKV